MKLDRFVQYKTWIYARQDIYITIMSFKLQKSYSEFITTQAYTVRPLLSAKLDIRGFWG